MKENEVQISIIIPVYNRSQLLGETLESISSQIFSDWECIIVDDGSTDYTSELIEFFCARDKRFQFFSRPKEKPKGANSCRNFGYAQSIGKFIIWFDSDDLMSPDHLQKKYNEITRYDCDFVVAENQRFDENGNIPSIPLNVKTYGITSEDFIFRRILWYTYDVILKRTIADQIRFNEKLFFWQDYNYFCKMLLVTTDGRYIEDTVTYRRMHAASMTTETATPRVQKLIRLFFLTFLDISKKVTPAVRKEMVRNLMNLSFSISKDRKRNVLIKEISGLVREEFGIRNMFLFHTALFNGFLFKKGEVILDKAKDKN